jgi:hypothetical protein
MTPSDIAKALTPAQVRALRNPHKCSRADFGELLRFVAANHGVKLLTYGGHTPLGLAVLAKLDKEARDDG